MFSSRFSEATGILLAAVCIALQRGLLGALFAVLASKMTDVDEVWALSLLFAFLFSDTQEEVEVEESVDQMVSTHIFTECLLLYAEALSTHECVLA